MRTISIPEPHISQQLFANTGMSLFWLVARLYVGWEWFTAGWDKIHSAAWVGAKAGMAVQGFLQGALQKTTGPHPDVSGWYAYFINHFVLNHTVLFSYLVAYGEIAVGLGLLLGAFTGIAAFFGAFMNLNYLLAGTVSTNPILLLIQLFLILAWRNAGWYGFDRFLLPLLGVPWQKGKLFQK